MNTQLQDQVFLVTGASGGIGAATTRLFVEEGARVVAHFHRNAASVEALASEFGDRLTPAQADLGDEDQTESMYENALADVDRLDGVVVNAGVWPPGDVPLHEMDASRWRETMRADLDSAFFTCRGFLRHLAATPRERASIVLVASTAGLFGEAGHADYAAAKSAMAYGLTLTLKNEIVALAPRGRVNCVCPGWTDTPMAADGLGNPALVERVLSTMPLKKIATAEDVARAIVFLSSDALSGHLTGSILRIAGGMEGRRLD